MADRSGKPGRSLVWLQGLACGAMAALALPSALLLALLLAPALAGAALDRIPGRPIARTMLLFGLSASVGPLRSLWAAGHTLDVASELLTPETIGLAWGAAGGGWLLTQFTPVLARLALESAAFSRKLRLRTLRARCVDEWGLQSPAPPDRS